MSYSLAQPVVSLSTLQTPAVRPRSQKTLEFPGAGRGQGPLPRDRESPCRSHWASFCAGCVALLGDPNQLLSVGAGNILSDLLTLGVPSICLQQQYRQSTDAAALRQNVVDFPKLNGEQELRWDDSFRLLPADDRAIPDLLCEEAARRYRAGESIQVLSPVRVKTGFSVQALNTRLQNEVNPLTAEKPTWGKFLSLIHISEPTRP
mgnify:CR=1 FL=1